MYRELTVIAMTGTMHVGAQALAGNSRNQAAMNTHQVVDCMSKRMSANKVEALEGSHGNVRSLHA